MKTDDEIRQDVEDELEWEPAIDHRQIGVAVKDGVVSLTGSNVSDIIAAGVNPLDSSHLPGWLLSRCGRS